MSDQPDPEYLTDQSEPPDLRLRMRSVEISKSDLRERVRALEVATEKQERALQIADAERAASAEVLRDEQRRATFTAESEREKAAAALRAGTDREIARLQEYVTAILDEKEKAAHVADEEREKSAAALREALARSISEGDERLREHITNQITQIKAALDSSDALELSRVTALHDEFEARMNAADRTFDLQLGARDEAIEKADKASEKRFDSVNEFRAQLNDQAHSFVTRELFDAKFEDIRKAVDQNTAQHLEYRSRGVGREEHQKQGQDASSVRAQMLAAIAGLFLVIVTIAGIGAAFLASKP